MININIEALVLASAGSGVAATFTYKVVRSTLFLKREVQDLAVELGKVTESMGSTFPKEELESFVKYQLHSALPLNAVVAILGWALFVLGLIKLAS